MSGNSRDSGVLSFGGSSSSGDPPKSSDRSLRGQTSASHNKILGAQNAGSSGNHDERDSSTKPRRRQAPNAKVDDIHQLGTDLTEKLQANIVHTRKDITRLEHKLDNVLQAISSGKGPGDLRDDAGGQEEGQDMQDDVPQSQDEVQDHLLNNHGHSTGHDDERGNDRASLPPRESARFSPPRSGPSAPSRRAHSRGRDQGRVPVDSRRRSKSTGRRPPRGTVDDQRRGLLLAVGRARGLTHAPNTVLVPLHLDDLGELFRRDVHPALAPLEEVAPVLHLDGTGHARLRRVAGHVPSAVGHRLHAPVHLPDTAVRVLHIVVLVLDVVARVPVLDSGAHARAPPPAGADPVLRPAVAARGLALITAIRVRVPPLAVINVDNGAVRSRVVYGRRAAVLPFVGGVTAVALLTPKREASVPQLPSQQHPLL
ncbi:hypothetical protein R3P38DRAFT_3211164 [Favolaschia claudopus]|uniref:Uncharacterized protein n=1 Tax=Favolaschia claudopus TaxID=2862362 RepID=A0AAW0AGR6_9AGAR